MDVLPMHQLRRCVDRYNGKYHMNYFSCLGHFFAWLSLNFFIENDSETSNHVYGRCRISFTALGFKEYIGLC